jgi:uncharacterized protein YaaQ
MPGVETGNGKAGGQMTNDQVDMLVVILISSDEIPKLSKELIQAGFYFTQVDSRGGFLSEEVASLLVGINRERYAPLVELVTKSCPRRKRYVQAQIDSPLFQGQPVMMEAEAGGATLFTLDVEHFEKF